MERKIRILNIIETLGYGGAEQALLNLLPNMQERGYHCEVAALWGPYDLAEKLEGLGIKVHCLDISHRWNLPAGVHRMNQLLKNNKYDVVISNLFFSDIYTGLTRRFSPGVKRVVQLHNLFYEYYDGNNAWRRLRKAVHKHLVKNCFSGKVAVSSAVRESYSRHFKMDGIHVIPNAIVIDMGNEERPQDRQAILSKYSLSSQDINLIMPARFVVEKGHPYLIKAVQLLKDEGLYPKLLFIGEGHLLPEVRDEIKRYGLESQISIHNSLPHAELFPLLKCMDFFVLPSTHEGLPLAPAEAMALGLPVIVTDVGGLRDLVEEEVSGLIVPPRDIPALANAIRRLMQDSNLRNRLSEAGKKRIEEHFSPRVVCDQWETYIHNELILS